MKIIKRKKKILVMGIASQITILQNRSNSSLLIKINLIIFAFEVPLQNDLSILHAHQQSEKASLAFLNRQTDNAPSD